VMDIEESTSTSVECPPVEGSVRPEDLLVEKEDTMRETESDPDGPNTSDKDDIRLPNPKLAESVAPNIPPPFRDETQNTPEKMTPEKNGGVASEDIDEATDSALLTAEADLSETLVKDADMNVSKEGNATSKKDGEESDMTGNDNNERTVSPEEDSGDKTVSPEEDLGEKTVSPEKNLCVQTGSPEKNVCDKPNSPEQSSDNSKTADKSSTDVSSTDENKDSAKTVNDKIENYEEQVKAVDKEQDKTGDVEQDNTDDKEQGKTGEKENKSSTLSSGTGLKLASFSAISGQANLKSPDPKSDVSVGEGEAAPPSEAPVEPGCSQCGKEIASTLQAVVWETMRFCDESCVGLWQATLDKCSSCGKEVTASSLGKYCVRFGSDIKQFCTNICLEDYKKGLKVCSYCQKDISGGEGFLAPIGDKGQFKDFCEQACLKKYEQIYLGKPPEEESMPCGVCKDVKVVVKEVQRAGELVKLCSVPCFNAFKFVQGVSTRTCDLCPRDFDVRLPPLYLYFSGQKRQFCSKPCNNVFVMQNRKIVACSYCKVKKYNFDMIERFPESNPSISHLYCSLNCLSLHNLALAKGGGGLGAAATPAGATPPRVAGGSPGGGVATPLPVISQVSSLAQTSGPPLPQPVPQQIQVQTQTVREVVKETHVLPAELPQYKNKGLQTKPFMMSKGVSCKPHPCHKETQTEGLSQPVPIPIPVPIYVPGPCKMYNAPYPVPIPIPLPFPVPVFIPTTRHSLRGIQKQIKKILNKIPADPFEAELLALAGDVAGEKDSSDSESDEENGQDVDAEYDEEGVVIKKGGQVPTQDLENEMSAEKVVPKPLPVSTPDPQDRQRMMQLHGKRSREDGSEEAEGGDATWKPKHLWEQNQGQGMKRGAGRPRGSRGRGSPGTKRLKSEGGTAVQTIVQPPKERPDASHHLKFTYGVNAWKHWVVGKNAELEKLRAQGKYQKPFETDILKLRADELNFTLCMFVKEVKKPNGDSYAADSVFYLVLGIQEYLFENSRIDNIFTDVYYDPFTSALHEVVKEFKLPVNELGYFVTRIEEEHLWESKQLGAHSPHVLLNTLVYFNTKYFQLKTVDQHLKLSFSHIMKHWKKSPVQNNKITQQQQQQQRTVLLRYCPPPAKGQKPEDRKMYEQHENHENPLRCPVKLYEFYLSKCPESTKNRNDMFYLQPERSCVPDNPVWYSAQLLNRFSMEKMLSRLLMVREVQEHMLADQTG